MALSHDLVLISRVGHLVVYFIASAQVTLNTRRTQHDVEDIGSKCGDLG